ncbi:putidacin L1 family lectin-like bacteriocin [Pseudomonas syringae]|uniref:putidacin L1 family lectin-like bacteriocin n=1 Tax=Pseudomonas syringae TaxID=317 RepID=UPI001372EE50|nr:putidacin L1 family lectin-like bacteriocin [Pseudomonas syringae]NAT23967.1 bacteriocin [Pseudomonas syringae pv. actinidifoliorum]NAT37977.1 bacteriocin [Pseudomonas syringae pv. actinidifoliorum]
MSNTITYTPFTRPGSNVLPPNQKMTIGQYLISPDGKYKLILQDDSNLVLYSEGAAVWAANADQPYSSDHYNRGYADTYLVVSNTGFLYDSLRGRLWSTFTNLSDSGLWYRSHLVLQDDGNVVILDVDDIFTTQQTTLLAGSDNVNIIPPGTSLEPGHFYRAGGYSLVFQGDGNLVVYTNDARVVWNSGTHNMGATQAVMQGDGNFVIYKFDGTAIWHTHTPGNPGAYAQIQNNGAFVVCKSTPTWARFGFTPSGKSRPVFYPDHTDPLENSTKPFPTYGHIGYEF